MKNGLKIIHAPELVAQITHELNTKGTVSIRGLGTWTKKECRQGESHSPYGKVPRFLKRATFKGSVLFKEQIQDNK